MGSPKLESAFNNVSLSASAIEVNKILSGIVGQCKRSPDIKFEHLSLSLVSYVCHDRTGNQFIAFGRPSQASIIKEIEDKTTSELVQILQSSDKRLLGHMWKTKRKFTFITGEGERRKIESASTLGGKKVHRHKRSNTSVKSHTAKIISKSSSNLKGKRR